VKSFKYAIQLEPNYPDAHNNLGNALRELGDAAHLDEAVQSYRSALALKPDHPYAYNNLGNAMKDKGLVKEVCNN
jgi:protein O-GlcNAc transferase